MEPDVPGCIWSDGHEPGAVYLQETEEPPNKPGIGRILPAQVATAMEVTQHMEHGGFKSLTHWWHPYLWKTGFD